jgi:hypothetical protein
MWTKWELHSFLEEGGLTLTFVLQPIEIWKAVSVWNLLPPKPALFDLFINLFVNLILCLFKDNFSISGYKKFNDKIINE